MADLKALLALQASQQLLWYDKEALTDAEKSEQVDTLVLGLHEEVGELARAIRRRHHVGQEREPQGNAVEGVVDTLKYLLAVCDILDINPDELEQRFWAKTQAVALSHRRLNQRLAGLKVLVTDLDGCVADIRPFLEATQNGQDYGEVIGTMEIEQAKADWYEAGGFLGLPMLDGAKEVLELAKEMGYLVAIITARPVWAHRRVQGDTVQWLADNGIPNDILVFDKDKFDALVRHVYPASVVGFIEDRPKHCLELAAYGVPVWLMETSWNKGFVSESPHITRCSGWGDIRDRLEHALGTDIGGKASA